MAKKNHYYVLVCTNHGPVFVTGIQSRSYAEWDKLKAPMECPKWQAEEIAYGLNLNGYTAVMAVYPFEMTHQLFYYENGQFEWRQNETEAVTDETVTCTA